MSDAFDSQAKREVTLHLVATEQESKKYCMYCRHFIFRSKHNLVKILEEEASDFLKPPITIHCSDCKTLYNIQTIY